MVISNWQILHRERNLCLGHDTTDLIIDLSPSPYSLPFLLSTPCTNKNNFCLLVQMIHESKEGNIHNCFPLSLSPYLSRKSFSCFLAWYPREQHQHLLVLKMRNLTTAQLLPFPTLHFDGSIDSSS